MAVASLTTLGLFGCDRRPLGGAPAEGELAEVTLALGETPASVRCVVVTVLTDKPDPRRFTPGGSQLFVLKRLPTGVVVFNVEAFAEPCSATAMAVPSWVADPVSVVLQPGANEAIAIKMRPNGQVSVSVDFSADGGPPRAPAGGACVADADCATGLRCAKDPAVPTGAGVCEAIPMATPVPVGPRVAMEFQGGKSYLLYADGGGEGCDTAGAGTSWVELVPGQTACLSGAGDVIPIEIESIDLCSADDTGGSCATCEDDSCLPVSCFPRVQLPEVDASCTRALPVPTARVRYLLFPHVDTRNPPARTAGLPALFTTSTRRQVTITPPANHLSFVRATMGAARPTPEQITHGDMCGGLNLCGIIPFREFAVSPFASWYFQSDNRLYSSPLY